MTCKYLCKIERSIHYPTQTFVHLIEYCHTTSAVVASILQETLVALVLGNTILYLMFDTLLAS